jgi:hypothetical protein
MNNPEPSLDGIAIIGLEGRFPEARNAAEFWENLVEGKDCITRFTDEQLAATGYDPKVLRALPGYVAARGLVEKPEWFDRAFFGVPTKEAEVMDPQHRVEYARPRLFGTTNSTVRQEITLQQGIPSDTAKNIVKYLSEQFYKFN